jgi:hypothetical protein
VPGRGGKGEDPEAAEPADLVEGSELEVIPIGPATIPPAVSFLNGIERWSVVAYDGVVQVVSAYVAAAVRRRDGQGVLHTTFEQSRSFAVAPLERMKPALREIMAGADVESIDAALADQPARYLEAVESTVRRARAR